MRESTPAAATEISPPIEIPPMPTALATPNVLIDQSMINGISSAVCAKIGQK